MTRLYRLLLRLYPASFRHEFGDDLTAAFAARLADAGSLARIGLVLEAVADVVPAAVTLHWDILRQDLRYTARSLKHARGFALTAILVAALGVGANTAAFSVADFVLLRPLPFPNADRLVRLWEQTPGYSRMELSPANYRDWKAGTTSFAAVGALTSNAVNLIGVGEPRRLSTTMVTPDLLPLLGVSPLLGRMFTPADSATDVGSVVLSHDLWQAQFGGDPAMLGRTLNLSGTPYEVIGVMPAAFRFPSRNAQLWMPLNLQPQVFQDRNDNYLEVVGRLRDGVTLEQASADVALIAARLAGDFPETNTDVRSNLVRLSDGVSAGARLLLLALCGAALCILLLACANLANLLLARASARERELAVRAALGAGRERLVRQMVTESLVLALAGGAAGVLLAVVAVPLLARLVPTTLPIAEHPVLDLRVLALAMLFTGVTGIGFGLIPAFRVGGRGGLRALREGARAGGGRKQRLRATLVTVEVAVSVVLLISAGLLVRAVWRLQAVDPGFRTAGVLTLRTSLPRPKFDSVARRDAFYTSVVSGVEALPGVERAAFISFLPMGMTGGIWPVVIQGTEVVRDAGNVASLRFVTPGFFDVMGIPVLRGRDLARSDTFDRPFVAVVSESFARRYWPEDDPIGRQFQFAFFDRTVVGVVGDIRVRGLERTSEPQVYLSHQQVPEGGLIFYDPKDLVIRSSAPAAALLPAVRRIIRAADPEQPISDVRTLEDIVAGQTASRRTQLRVLGALAVIALLLAGVGIHGLLAFTVSQRSREIGVRLALGAKPGGIARMIFREGVALAALGIVPGIILAYAAARGMRALLVGVPPSDPATIGVAVGAALVMTVVGALLPALRAVRVSPMEVMRTE